MLVVAEPGARFTVVQELTSAEPELEAYLNGVVEVVVRDGAKAEIVNLQRLSSKAWLFASCHARVERDAELDWVEGGFGSSRGKVWIQNDLADRGATSRVTGAYFADGSQHLDYDTYQLHAAPDTTSDFAFKGALRDTRRHRLARDDPRRGGRPEDERLPGEPQPAPLEVRDRELDPRARDPRERRPLHPRRDALAGRPRAALLPDGPRPAPRRRPSG